MPHPFVIPKVFFLNNFNSTLLFSQYSFSPVMFFLLVIFQIRSHRSLVQNLICSHTAPVWLSFTTKKKKRKKKEMSLPKNGHRFFKFWIPLIIFLVKTPLFWIPWKVVVYFRYSSFFFCWLDLSLFLSLSFLNILGTNDLWGLRVFTWSCRDGLYYAKDWLLKAVLAIVWCFL